MYKNGDWLLFQLKRVDAATDFWFRGPALSDRLRGWMSPDAKLTALLEAYRQAEPNRYRGGIVALTGFQYQVWSYLADFAQALVSKDLLAGGPAFTEAFEALSDYTRTGEMETVCVQVKHHLDRRRMSEAAAEFASIDRFLNSHDKSALRIGINYEVVARGGDSSLDWDDVQLPAELRARQPNLVDHFEEIRRTGRLRPPRFESDPRWKFIATVFGRVTDPFGFARRSLERCLLRSTVAESAAYIRNAIAEDYTANVLRGPIFSQFLRPSHFELDPGGRGTSIARTPTLLDLRSGRFMDRQHRIGEVLATLDDLVESYAGADEPVIPILWIDGRSGSGKSVLLLQLMRYLVIDRNASVVWLTRTEELGPMIDQLAAVDDSLQPDFVFVDDIYDPHARDDLDVPLMSRRIVHSGQRKWPLVITCGPTEFRQDFERDCRAEGFRIVPWHLGTLLPPETAALRTWFEGRTGTVPQSGPAQGEERALIVSVMFEMAHGDLRPFALRFRARLVESQVQDALMIPLALNRLYIWSPRNWLSSRDLEKIERINQDGDFSFLSIEVSVRGLLKLTHPHLSDAVYRALNAQSAPFTFADHLVTAFTNALSSHLPTASRLLRAVASNQERLAIADQEELERGFTLAWNRCDKSKLPRTISAEMWVSWTGWTARSATIATSLGNAPLDVAIDLLGADHPRFVSQWLQLFQVAPGDPRLQNLAQRWLSKHNADEGWSYLWSCATEGLLQGGQSLDQVNSLLQLGWQWLQESLFRTGWSWVWMRLISAHGDDRFLVDFDTLVAKGAEWCTANGNAKSWSYVWGRLTEIVGRETPSVALRDIHKTGLEWLIEHYNHTGWTFVWEHFMTMKEPPTVVSRAELVRMAHSWRIGRENDVGWSYLSRNLTRSELGTAKVDIEPTVVWVEQHRDNPKWLSLWSTFIVTKKYLASNEQLQRLFKSGYSWLADDDERDGAISVAHRLLANQDRFGKGTDEKWLVEKSVLILTRSVPQDDPAWVSLWLQCFAYARSLSTSEAGALPGTLIELGRLWLAVPNHVTQGYWTKVFKPLRKGLASENWARKMALDAISRGFVPDEREAANLAVNLYSEGDEPEPSDELIAWFDRWFSRRATEEPRHGRRSPVGRYLAPAKVVGTRGLSKWLSLDRSERRASQLGPSEQWIKFRRLLDTHRPEQASSWQKIVEAFVQHEPVPGRVIKTALKRRGTQAHADELGYVVDIGINAFMPLDEAGIELGSEAERLELVGRIDEFEVIGVDEERFQIDVSRRAVLARRQSDASTCEGPDLQFEC